MLRRWLARWVGATPLQAAGLALALGGSILCFVLMFLPARYPRLLDLAVAMIGGSLLMLDFRRRKP